MADNTANRALSGAQLGTNNANLYVQIAGKGTGTLTGADVDPKLGTADRLLDFDEEMAREVNAVAENNLFSAGAISASWVYIEIYRTGASVFAQQSLTAGSNITPISVYRVDTIGGKYTVTEQIDYTNCIITKTKADSKLNTLKIWFRYTGRTDTVYFFNQEGQPQGQNVATVDFTKGTLQAAPAGGGGGGGGDASGGGAPAS